MKVWLFVVLLSMFTSSCWAQDKSGDEFSRKNTWTVFAEYSNTSSHIVMGAARQRVLADFGGAYTRRVFRFNGSTLSYQMEVRPVLFESDPVTFDSYTTTVTYSGQPPVTYTGVGNSVNIGKCQAGTYSFVFTPPPGSGLPDETGTEHFTCGKQ